MTQSVQTLVDGVLLLGEDQFQIVEAVRALAAATIQPLSEEVKYGGIMFASDVPFAGVFAYKHHVSVEFSHGAHIVDSDGLLEGSGQFRRHLKLRSLGDIKTKRVCEFLMLALEASRRES